MDIGQQHDASSDEESEMEWEEVEAAAPSQPEASTSGQTPAAAAGDVMAGDNGRTAGVEITLRPSSITVGGKAKGKGKGRPAGFSLEAQIERSHRQELHKIHTCCLLMSGHVRNGWINDKSLQARLLSKVPLDAQNRFHEFNKATHPRATDRSRLFESAMRNLMKWWYERFWFDDTQRGVADGKTALFDLLAAPHSIHTDDYLHVKAMVTDLSTRDRIRLLMPFAEDEDLEKLNAAYPPSPQKGKTSTTPSKKKAKLPKPLASELGELIRNSQSLAKRAVQMVGTRDMSAQLFTALCRALDIPARLVCALPSMDHRSASKARADDKLGDFNKAGSASGSAKKRKLDASHTEDSDDTADFEEVKIPSSVPKRAIKKTNGNSSDVSSAGKRSKAGASMFAARNTKASTPVIDIDEVIPTVPNFWTEVYNRSLQEWVTVDVIRNKFRPRKGEMDNGRMFYVVAYEMDQYMKDVTPRYAKSYAGRTLKMRIQNRRKDDPDWWDEIIRPWMRPFSLGRELKEDQELARHQDAEPMPTVLEGFKNHPRFVLERHLKREETLIPKTKQLGLFRGEPVFPRSAVVGVKSSENWMREGRTIKDGEQPLKTVKQRAVTINKRRAQEMAMQEGQEPLMQGLYSRHQTEMVIPPPIVDGKVPKNSYGNLDLFAPHMLPAGGVHLPHRNIRKVARELGIDHAEAITGFEFHKRRAVPTVTGIVVAKEHEEMLLEAYYAQETIAVEKEMQKRKERALKKWKKLIIGLRVRSRIQGEYKKDKAVAGIDTKGKGKAQEQETEPTSQFQLAPGDDVSEHPPLKSEASAPDASALPGGFISGSLHPEIPGGAVFLPVHPHEAPIQDDGPQIDLTLLDLPPMPIPEPAADGATPPPLPLGYRASASPGPHDAFIYPESQLDAMALDADSAQRGEEVTAGGFIPDFEAPYEGANGVQLDDFTLRSPEELAIGAPEITDDEEDDDDGEYQDTSKAAAPGGFLRDNESADVDMDTDGRSAASSARPRIRFVNHAKPPPSKEDTAEEDEDSDVEMTNAIEEEELKPAKPTRAVMNGNGARGKQEEHRDEEELDEKEDLSEGQEDSEDDEEADYREPTPPTRPVRSARPTRAAAQKQSKTNGSTSKSSPVSTRRSTRASKGSVASSSPAASTRKSTRSTRASQRTAKEEEEEEEETEEEEKTKPNTKTRTSRRKSTSVVDQSASSGRPTRSTRSKITVTQIGSTDEDEDE